MPITPEQEQVYQRLQQLARWLDDQFRVPFTRYRFGWDGLIGLVPVVGDVLSVLLALYIIVQSRRLGVPGRLQLDMLRHLGIDLVAGSMPVLGDLFDFGYKANRRNLDLAMNYIEAQREPPPAKPKPTWQRWLWWGLGLLVVAMCVIWLTAL